MTFYVNKAPGRTINVDNSKYLYFGGTAYLGLQTHPEQLKSLQKNIKRYGTNYGASRVSNMQFSRYERAEKKLAQKVGSEACLTLSSGFLTGQMLRQYFIQKGHQVFYMPRTHPAMMMLGESAPRTYDELFTNISETLRSTVLAPVLFFDTIDFEGGNYPDFTFLKKLPLQKIILVADDSHGFGAVGKNGLGNYKALEKLAPKELLVTGSLGKGWATQGGAIFGSQKRIHSLVKTTLFSSASPTPPAYLATLINSWNLQKKQYKRLKRNISLFKSMVQNLDAFTFFGEHPTFGFDNNELVKFLLDQKIIITHFDYNVEDEKNISRIVISAHHKKKDIRQLADHINLFYLQHSAY